MWTVTVSSPEATQQLGEALAQGLVAGDVILLDGDLGAGKTTFTKGLARGLHIKRNIKSPTFTIIREYQEGRLPLYHMDIYRLDDGSGADLGLEEYFNGDGVSVVEWSNFVADEIPDDHLKIIFKRNDEAGEATRELSFIPHGDHYEQLVRTLEGQQDE
ncbi:tRNA (adenosine(37)-N6)-threonylcarbamoyltransferase complex ATPase subunit type 1 TsaE [Levilactobacillus bambusae]|uniref:tRNA threonylcarbamoyladenosine biosynthesis protein TsaE n=1 Tax=Levilactobacillus bambusae TaxID=2024736 RepID=A0A2V1MZ82_9LACO|nr:tRNA (adenosine(37)-N6)-threonylcarbamoyltransferase complex ATPase subunit type 1 TsaE [Levilactobacillus bambusae]PWF99455.1 tRNA (adenosine(37)-N6)-threonylcarbamoyltransferase complex ATPase subunit type 1 TsaE [Levilactobacillus bambusae]